MVSSNRNKIIMIIGPRYLRSSIKIETSSAATRLIESAHKKGDRKSKVIKAPSAFPNLKFSTIGKMNRDESKIVATMITETTITNVR